MTANPVMANNMKTEPLLVKDILDYVYFHHVLTENALDQAFRRYFGSRFIESFKPSYYATAETLPDKETFYKVRPSDQVAISWIPPHWQLTTSAHRKCWIHRHILPIVSEVKVIFDIVTRKDFLRGYLKQHMFANILLKELNYFCQHKQIFALTRVNVKLSQVKD